MSNVKVELNKQGLIEFLKSSEMLALVESRAKGIAGPDQEVESFVGFDRAHAIVKTVGGENADRSNGD